MQYLTAYGALIDIAGLKSGATVVIPAASSRVGLAAIQIANKVGATPIALTRGRSKRQALVDTGAAHVIATDEKDLAREIRAITGGKDARVVFDPVGGPTLQKLTKAMACFGILFIYGALSTEPTPLPLLNVLANGLTIRGYSLMESRPTPYGWSAGSSSSTRGWPMGASSPSSPRRSRSSNRGGAPVHGVEPTNRQNCGHRLRRNGGRIHYPISSKLKGHFMPSHRAEAEWKGNLIQGSGRLKVGSGAFEGPYSFKSRFEEGQSATNPEELIGAAHAGCFTMALTAQLSRAGLAPARIHTVAKVKLEKVGDTFAITRIDLETEADIPAIEDAAFQKHALDAKQNCPVSKALAGTEIHLNARLV
jgi:OsmC subfamily peroxiredoxin